MTYQPLPQTPVHSITADNAVASEHYFTQARDAFEHSVEHSTDIRHYYRIGPNVLCLRFAGDALVPSLTAALAHREIAATTPSLTILCCDDSVVQSSVRSLSHSSTGDTEQTVRSFYAPGVPCLNLYRAAERTGIYWVEQAGSIPSWELSFPFRQLFHWWCQDTPFQMVHAGAVGTEKGGVLLTGKGGSGKSSTALACLNSPLDYVGDDYVLVSSEPGPYVYNVYNTAKLAFDNLNNYPHLAGKNSKAQAMPHEKALFFLHQHYPQKIREGFPIRAIFLPRITHEQATRLSPATASEVLLAMAPTTLRHLDGDSRLAMDKMSQLVQSVPSYWLELGTDLENIPMIIANFLEVGHG